MLLTELELNLTIKISLKQLFFFLPNNFLTIGTKLFIPSFCSNITIRVYAYFLSTWSILRQNASK